MIDYKHRVDAPKEKLVSSDIAAAVFVFGVFGWMLSIYLLDKFF